MSCKVQQSVCSDCVTYAKSRIKFNTFNTFNNVEECIIKIIEDKYALEMGLRIIMETAERKVLPEEIFLPTFNDSLIEETFVATLEKVAGKKYK